MAPLTSPLGCVSCARLYLKVEQLEERISTLYKIQEAEQFLDTIVIGPAGCITTAGPVSPPATAPDTAASSAAIKTISSPPVIDAAVAATCPAAVVNPPPTIEPNDSWIRLGAKPKLPVSSTPSHHERWTLVKSRNGGSRRPAHALADSNLQLVNKFDTFNLFDFPPLPAVESGPRNPLSPPIPPPTGSERASQITGRRSSPHFTPAPSRAGPGRSADRGTRRSTQPVSSAPAPALAPSSPSSPICTLLIGDSILRRVRSKRAHTLFFPGATVLDIADKIPDILQSYPDVNRIVLHVGTNDTLKQQSELLKKDFNHLFSVLKLFRGTVHISGPTPTLGRMGRFSRLLNLNTWLSSACATLNVNFIDNFNLFWQRNHLFGADGLHLNKAGARILSANLSYSIAHPRTQVSDGPLRHHNAPILEPGADRFVTA